jgi:formate dehydrogenase accessory protein FdhE
MTRNPINEADPIIQRLRALVEQSPDLKEAARLYEGILPVLRNADLHVAPVSLTPEQARAKMAGGLPLLHGMELEFDRSAAHELMTALASALENIGGNNRTRYRMVRLALQEGRLDAGNVLSLVAAGEKNAVQSLAENLRIDPGLLWTLAQNALKPALHSWRRQLTPLIENIPWQKGYCFICGAGAILGELQDNNLTKHLRCGQCGADWTYSRLRCLHCGNEDHHTLSYLCAEPDDEKTRVEVCDRCRGYLKIITSFAPTPPDMLPVEDLKTLHLDYVAKERGYTHPLVEARIPRINGATIETNIS